MIISNYNVELARSFDGYKYTNKLTDQEKINLRDIIINALEDLDIPLIYQPSFKACEKELDELKLDRPLAIDVSSRRSDPALLYTKEGDIIITVNDVEHIIISVSLKNGSIYDSYNKAKMIEEHLGKKFKFQYDKTFGYLTSSFKICGNGLLLDTFLHVPTLMLKGRLHDIADKIKKHRGADLIPYAQSDKNSAFFVLRVISKSNVEEDLKFVKNMVEEMVISEENEGKLLTRNDRNMGKIIRSTKLLLTKEDYDNNLYHSLDMLTLASKAGECDFRYKEMPKLLRTIRYFNFKHDYDNSFDAKSAIYDEIRKYMGDNNE